VVSYDVDIVVSVDVLTWDQGRNSLIHCISEKHISCGWHESSGMIESVVGLSTSVTVTS
jgi:hypothetical protein